MDERDFVNVLKHYRHDLMNDLQIVYGYLSMGKVDKVENKISACLTHYNEERKLMSLAAPKFALWVIRFNSIYDNFHLTYQIHIENKHLQDVDELLVERSNVIINSIHAFCSPDDLLEVNLKLEEWPEPARIKVTILIDDCAEILDIQKIKEEHMELENETSIFETPAGLVFHFPIRYSMRGEK